MTAAVQLRRLPDWQLRMEAFVRARQDMPFDWGTNDCYMFAAACVLAITGQDIAADLRGKYSTELGAARILKRRGGIAAVVSAALGEPVGPLMARVGDVLLVTIDGQPALGVCNGMSVLGPSADGVRAYGLGVALSAWRIG